MLALRMGICVKKKYFVWAHSETAKFFQNGGVNNDCCEILRNGHNN